MALVLVQTAEELDWIILIYRHNELDLLSAGLQLPRVHLDEGMDREE